MPTNYTVPKTPLAFGPGALFWAPLGSALPANTVAGSVFTDAWSAVSGNPWVPFGVTSQGSTFSYQLNTSDILVEEYIDPLGIAIDGRVIGISFDLAVISQVNLRAAMNGGTSTVTGTTGTTLTKYAPPALGAEVQIMIGWESQDNTERFIAYQCLQAGQLSIPRRKGVNYATLSVDYRVTQPASGDPFNHWLAGTARA